MYILALNGSPNTDGNTAKILNFILDEAERNGADRVELVQVGDLISKTDQPFCVGCQNPCEEVRCVKGPVKDALDKLKEADAVILGSPVYFGSVTGQLKAFWDKTRSARKQKSLQDTPGAAVSVGASRFGGQEKTIRTLQDMMLIQGMTIVGDGSIEYNPGHQGVAGQREILEDDNAVERARVLAHRLVYTARKLES